MKCFYHPAVDAVAICKNCNKGLCVECAKDVGNGMACIGRCEAEVAAVNEAIQRGKKSFEKAANTYFKMALWVALLGGCITAGGVITSAKGGKGGGSILIGLIFLLGAAFYYSSGREYRSRD